MKTADIEVGKHYATKYIGRMVRRAVILETKAHEPASRFHRRARSGVRVRIVDEESGEGPDTTKIIGPRDVLMTWEQHLKQEEERRVHREEHKKLMRQEAEVQRAQLATVQEALGLDGTEKHRVRFDYMGNMLISGHAIQRLVERLRGPA